MKSKPALIHELERSPLSGEEIERRSFSIINREAPRHRFNREEWEIVRRMIHTTGDFGIMEDVRFANNAIAAGIAALRAGRPIYVDSQMIRNGLSLPRLRTVCPSYARRHLLCRIAAPSIAAAARKSGLPRSLFAVRSVRKRLHDAIIAFGNAPVGLLEVNRLILEEGLRPALVIAMPVGFVHVTESKRELVSLDVPSIVLQGRRGGSPLAVSVIHALCSLASRDCSGVGAAASGDTGRRSPLAAAPTSGKLPNSPKPSR